MSKFLKSLGSVIDQQFALSDNKQNTLDVMDNGNVIKYGALGDFAKKFDHSAERSYYEQGFTPHSGNPKFMQLLMQEPNVTVLVKKKEFAALKDNYDLKYIDNQEKQFLRAASILFENKCSQISAYEKLVKIEKIAVAQSKVDAGILPILLNLYDFAGGPQALGIRNILSENFKSAMEKVRKLVAYNKISTTTSWMHNPNQLFKSSYGSGTGVIELTTFSDFTSNVGLGWSDGSGSLTFEDPYKLMLITPRDIEQAIADSVAPLRYSAFINETKKIVTEKIDKDKRLLNIKRRGRNVNPINFIINTEAYLGKRIRVLIDGLGYEVNIASSANFSNPAALLSGNLDNKFDPAADFGSEELGNQGLTNDEKRLIESIINSFTSLLSQDINSQKLIKKGNEETNELRRRLLLHYGNKHIISPFDVVHVYIESKTRTDSKLVAGLETNFNQIGFMQNLSKQFSDISQSVKTLFNPSSFSVDLEKSVFVGSNFPNALWSILRNQFVTDKAGAHVFAGLIGNVSGSYGSGKYTLSVSLKDFSNYFDMGVVNFSPSLDNAQQPLYDPITPFKLNINRLNGVQSDVPQPLDENKKIWQSYRPKFSDGRNAGKFVTEENHQHQDSDTSLTGSIQNIFYPPSGTVYRWKEGVATLTLKDGTAKGFNTSIPTQQVPRLTVDNAFAGQDAMNILSLLITGEPHNFTTFFKKVIEFDGVQEDFFKDPSFYRNLQNDLKKNSRLWGNFTPFKKLVMSEASVAMMINTTLQAQAGSTELDTLTSERAKIFDTIAATVSSDPEVRGGATVSSGLTERIKIIDSKIETLTTTLNLTQSLNGELSQIGDDVTFDVSQSSLAKQDVLNNPKARKELRRKSSFLTRRLMYRVKANEDSNLFIVDDVYDKDVELQAFAASLGDSNLSVFQNNYSSVSSKIREVAGIMNLEIFTDTQGHIQVRPPQYNRIPNSVLVRMLGERNATGVQVFPQFLQDLYSNQAQTYLRAIEVVEDQIRLQAAGLGFTTDELIKSNLLESSFSFLTNPDTGRLQDLNWAKYTDPDDIFIGVVSDLARETQTQATSVRFAASAVQRSQLANKFSFEPNEQISIRLNVNEDLARGRIVSIRNRLRALTGVSSSSLTKLFTKNGEIKANPTAQESLTLAKEISRLVSERQRAVKVAASALRTISETSKLQKGVTRLDSSALSKLAFPNLYDQKNVPEVLEHMVEDESFDDLGPGSGARFVIKDQHIITFNYQENEPEFNFIQVNGLFGGTDGFRLTAPGTPIGSGGTDQVTAFGIDYDSWKMYGFRASQQVEIPYLSEPETQLAPYAVALLNRARGKILTATAQIVGNEYMQPGEVIYFEPLNMLFYVEKVSHTVRMGGTFTTNLVLGYGRNPGEYIPTPFDIIGKVLYKNRDTYNQIISRNSSAYPEENLGAIVVAFDFDSADPASLLQNDTFGKQNIAVLNNIKNATIGLFNRNPGQSPKIELRYYHYSNQPPRGAGSSPSIVLVNVANFISNALTSPGATVDRQKLFGKDQTPSEITNAVVEPKSVDISSEADYRSPSSKAFAMAKELSGKNIDNIANKLTGNIIDIWINYGSE